MTGEQWERFREDMHWAKTYARRYAYRKDFDRDDAEACSLVGLWRAAVEYDPTRGEWRPFAGRLIRREIIDWQRSFWHTRNKVEFTPIDDPESGEEPPSGDHPVGWELQSEETILALTAPLRESDRLLVRALCLRADCETQEKAAAEFGVDRGDVALAVSRLRAIHRPDVACDRESRAAKLRVRWDADAMRSILVARPDATWEEVAAAYLGATGVPKTAKQANEYAARVFRDDPAVVVLGRRLVGGHSRPTDIPLSA